MPIKRILVLTLILFALAIRPAPAVRKTIVSTGGKSGAMLYFSPDSEPIAHKTTEINLELQDDVQLQDRPVVLVIEDSVGGIKETIPVGIHNRTITGFFVFPIRGLYKLTFTVGNDTQPERLSFVSEQQVLKGVHGADPARKTPIWAKVGLVVSAWSFLILIFKGVGFVRRAREH